MAITTTTPDDSNFSSARDYAAWLGLTPKQHSTSGKSRSGLVDPIMGQSLCQQDLGTFPINHA
ncbi:MAG: transposase [Parvularculaceae bacterium]